ncbi:hypothetical protein ACOSP7_015926 [Xanthoceras sorbifolium]
MERESNKRGREEGENKIDCFAMKTAKMSKQEIYQHHHDQHCYDSDHHHQDTRQEESDESYILCDHNHNHNEGKYVGLGVFDFPWLHGDEGMISKSDEEYWNFQDTFWWSVDGAPEADVEYNRQCLYESVTPSMNNKLEVWPLEGVNGMEMESVECIWSWMVNQPLQQGHDA